MCKAHMQQRCTLRFLKISLLGFVQPKIFVPPLIQVVCYQY